MSDVGEPRLTAERLDAIERDLDHWEAAPDEWFLSTPATMRDLLHDLRLERERTTRLLNEKVTADELIQEERERAERLERENKTLDENLARVQRHLQHVVRLAEQEKEQQ